MNVLHRLIERYGRKKVLMMSYLLGLGAMALMMRVLMHENLYHSSLLYVLIPYCVSIVITLFRPSKAPETRWQQFFSHIFTAMSLFLSAAILVGEGFVCIIFFAPIYFFIVILAYIVGAFTDRDKRYSFVLPVLLLVVSLEGVTPNLSFPRQTYVEVKKTTSLTPEQIKSNLAQPFDLNQERHWLIAIFPMPYHVEAGSLNSGDVHTVFTRYHRWFVTNTHEGKAELLIEEVKENYIKTRFLSDTTYFSTYLSGTGTEIYLQPNNDGGTDITLRIHYRRNLDPVWYFHPLQQFAVTKMGELLIKELMIRGDI